MSENENEDSVIDGPKMSKKVENITNEATLKVLATSNIKREGSASYERFQNYFNLPENPTVADALEAGLTMGDIRYDTIHGNIEVDGALITEYEVIPRGEKVDDEEVALDSSDDGLSEQGPDGF